MQNIVRTPQQLGAILRRARRLNHLSQKELGEKAKLWQETISKIENGAPGTKVDTLFDLLAVLDLELTIGPRKKGQFADIGEIF